MYADGANHRSDGLPNEPRYSHLNTLHYAVAAISSDLVSHDAQLGLEVPLQYRLNASQPWQNGTNQVSIHYGATAFVENAAAVRLEVLMGSTVIELSAFSIIVLRSGAVYWNSSAVKDVPNHRTFTSATTQPLQWRAWPEPLFSADRQASEQGEQPIINSPPPVIQSDHPMEQLSVTRDLTDYLYYSTAFTLTTAVSRPVITIEAVTACAFQVFINDRHAGAVDDHSHGWTTEKATLNLTVPLDLPAGRHVLTLLSSSLGNQNGMTSGEDPLVNHQMGVRLGGAVYIGQLKAGSPWLHRPYMVGEWLEIYRRENEHSVAWTAPQGLLHRPLTWFTTSFVAVVSPTPTEHSALVLDITGLQRGHCFVNGYDLGRYWNILGRKTGMPTQRYYFIPQDWLLPAGQANTLTIFEELGAINFDTVKIEFSTIVYGSWAPAEPAEIVALAA